MEHAGKISHELALQMAETEYDKYNKERLAAEDIKALENLNEEIKKIRS